MKKLFISIFTCVFALFALGTSTFAWFSMNKTASATGMQVKATTSSSLVITNVPANIDIDATNTIALTPVDRALEPATYNADSATKLVYVSNTQYVDAVTGLKQANAPEDLDFEDVPESNTSKYYIDYTVYIASKGAEMPNQKLTAKIDTSASLTGDGDIYNAVTVAYWVAETSEDTLAWKVNDNFKDLTDAEEIFVGTIPAAEEGYITVVMRVYFDGALNKTATSTHVNNGSINLNEVTFSVTFQTADNE